MLSNVHYLTLNDVNISTGREFWTGYYTKSPVHLKKLIIMVLNWNNAQTLILFVLVIVLLLFVCLNLGLSPVNTFSYQLWRWEEEEQYK